MKKYMLIFLLLIFVSGVYAQELKFIGGSIFSKYTDQWPPSGYYPCLFALNDLNPFRNHKTGFLAGAGIELKLHKIIALELDGLYFQKGSTFVYETHIWSTIKDIYIMEGFSFPLLIKVKPFPRPFPYVLGGGEVSFIISHKKIRREWGESGSYEYRQDMKQETEKADYGLILGCGFEVRVSNALFFVEARYTLGLVNLVSKWIYWLPYYPDIKTRALAIVGGISL